MYLGQNDPEAEMSQRLIIFFTWGPGRINECLCEADIHVSLKWLRFCLIDVAYIGNDNVNIIALWLNLRFYSPIFIHLPR